MTSSPSPPALLASATLISQGAEAKVYKAYLHSNSTPVLLKHRFRKKYRHPSLDTSLTRSRVAGEARALLRCLRSGVNVPGIRVVDVAEDLLGIEWIEGNNVRSLLPGGDGEVEDEEKGEQEAESESDYNDDDEIEGDSEAENPLSEYGISQENLMVLIGNEIAKMHSADIIHGDLTTSNMMLRHPLSFRSPPGSPHPTELVLIDFGLAYQSSLVEDKAVDLYVLERAFSSTHPDSEPLFASVLKAYEERMGKDWGAIGRRLADVRLRGRKRSMVG